MLRFLLIGFFGMLAACRNTSGSEICRLVVRTRQTSLDSITIYRTGFLGAADREVFRGALYGPKDSAVIRLPFGNDSLYELRFQYAGKRTFLVADCPDLSIRFDQKNDQWETTPMSSTSAIQRLLSDQRKFADSARRIREKLNAVSPDGPGKRTNDSLSRMLALLDSSAQAKVIAFTDTAQSPAAFLIGYSLFQPQDRYRSAQRLIRGALNRFPKSAVLIKLDSQMTTVARIYEGELKVGDSLPDFNVQSLNGDLLPSSRWRGKTCLINIWAPWQSGAYGFMLAQKKLLKALESNAPQLVSIAFDDDPAACRKMVEAVDARWTQLIDTAMWQGQTARALKNDSLPYNFLVSAEGRILDKAIPADSLLPRVMRVIKRRNNH